MCIYESQLPVANAFANDAFLSLFLCLFCVALPPLPGSLAVRSATVPTLERNMHGLAKQLMSICPSALVGHGDVSLGRDAVI